MCFFSSKQSVRSMLLYPKYTNSSWFQFLFACCRIPLHTSTLCTVIQIQLPIMLQLHLVPIKYYWRLVRYLLNSCKRLQYLPIVHKQIILKLTAQSMATNFKASHDPIDNAPAKWSTLLKQRSFPPSKPLIRLQCNWNIDCFFRIVFYVHVSLFSATYL